MLKAIFVSIGAMLAVLLGFVLYGVAIVIRIAIPFLLVWLIGYCVDELPASLYDWTKIQWLMAMLISVVCAFIAK